MKTVVLLVALAACVSASKTTADMRSLIQKFRARSNVEEPAKSQDGIYCKFADNGFQRLSDPFVNKDGTVCKRDDWKLKNSIIDHFFPKTIKEYHCCGKSIQHRGYQGNTRL